MCCWGVRCCSEGGRSCSSRTRFLASQVCTYHPGKSISPVLVSCGLMGRLNAAMFPAAVVRCKTTDTANSVFSGSVVIVGCKSEDDGNYAAHLLVDAICRYVGIQCSVVNFHVRNLVYRVELPFATTQSGGGGGGLDLERLHRDAIGWPETDRAWDEKKRRERDGISYDKRKFPGLAWRVHYRDLRATFTLFASGRGVLTGVTHESQRRTAIELLLLRLPPYENEPDWIAQLGEGEEEEQKAIDDAEYIETEEVLDSGIVLQLMP